MASGTDEIRFDDPHPWTLSQPADIGRFLLALPTLFGESSIAYVEGTGEKHVAEYLQELSVPARVRIVRGTIWPRPDSYHIPLTRDKMAAIAAFLETHPAGYFCDHFHVYRDSKVLLEWYDAFEGAPIHISRAIDETEVNRFAAAIRTVNSAFFW